MRISSSIRCFIDLPVILIIISPLLPTAFSSDNAGNNFRASICSGNYIDNNYALSLKYLMADLAANTSLHHGFMNTSRGQVPEDRAYGLALCRGDISKPVYCSDCLTQAVANINCSHSSAAIIWYDHCLLKYSAQKFSGQIDTDNNYYMCSGDSASDAFTNDAKGLLNKLAGEAANQTDTMFANGTTNALYGMVQCTRDLHVKNCTACLKGAIDYLSRDCLPKVSGNFFYGSCVVRYDIHPFLL